MGLVKKANVPPVLLAEEEVDVPELGGSVIVRSPGLAERLSLSFAPKEGQKHFAHLASLLAVSVLDGDYQPIYTVPEWEAFGSKPKNLSAAMRLWDIAWRLADFNGEQAEKNETAPNSD